MNVRLHIDGTVALITLAAPERRNALDGAMARELAAALSEVEADLTVANADVRTLTHLRHRTRANGRTRRDAAPVVVSPPNFLQRSHVFRWRTQVPHA